MGSTSPIRSAIEVSGVASVEQSGEGADHAGLGLPALPQEDHVVASQDGVLQLGHDRVFVAEHGIHQRLTGPYPSHGVAADLLFDRDRLPSGITELTEVGGATRHGVDATAATSDPAAPTAPER